MNIVDAKRRPKQQQQIKDEEKSDFHIKAHCLINKISPEQFITGE